MQTDFGAWVDELEQRQRVLGGATMDESGGMWIGATPETFSMTGRLQLDGNMVIQAATIEAAWQIASTAPHLAFGGAIELWPQR